MVSRAGPQTSPKGVDKHAEKKFGKVDTYGTCGVPINMEEMKVCGMDKMEVGGESDGE